MPGLPLRSHVSLLVLVEGCLVAAPLTVEKQMLAAADDPVPLFSQATRLEADTIEDTPTALITRIGDRVRDRHAREREFQAYDHFLPFYWENRTVAIEIIDRVAKGGDSITVNMTSLVPLNEPNLRLFFEGQGTVAQYSHNVISKQVDRGSEQSDPGSVSTLADTDLENIYRYVATLGVPPRRNLDDADTSRGEALFNAAHCARCHVPTMQTSLFHPLAELRNQTIHPYTDLLLHDLGAGLSDNLAEGNAAPSEWRTPLLWGVGLTEQVSGEESYLHDGRARTLNEAILWHAGEAQESKELFRNMSAADRAAVLKFVESL